VARPPEPDDASAYGELLASPESPEVALECAPVDVPPDDAELPPSTTTVASPE
jgi:hypothetical protein